MSDTKGGPGVSGYVEFQDNPYRGHQLLIGTVLEHTDAGDRIFEGGVSTGYLSAAFVAADRIVDGAEVDPDTAAAARGVCDRIFVGDLEQLDLGQLAPSYQALVFGDTLEHLRDPPALLRRLRAVLDDDGVLVVSIPNVANWAVRLGLLFGRFAYTERGILDRTHLRFYTRRSAIEMLASAGFRATKVVAAVPVPWVSSVGLSRVAHRIGNLRPSLFAYTFIITAEKIITAE
ncbi:MAG TPA: methyltransferase domain-containing protein, partial [Acidimicrobiales bacterium]|nr:methyltransferase domain-containing protein [Acidimicrobiales bacterium]